MSNSSLLQNSYRNWLKTNNIVFSDIENEYGSISTSFLDNNFDNITLYAKFITKNKIELSDFGNTIFNLEEAGIHINKRYKTAWRIFQQTLRDFGIKQQDEALTIETSLKNFPIAKNRLLQGILRINDLKYLSKENVQSSFNDLLANFFKENKVLFSSNIEIANSDGISSHFDFSVPSNDKKEKLLKTVGRPNDVNQAKIFNYDVQATSLVRDADYILILDDKNHKTSIEQDTINTALNGLDNINAKVIGSRELMQNNQLVTN